MRLVFFCIVLFSHLIKIEQFHRNRISNDIPRISNSLGNPSKIRETSIMEKKLNTDLKEINKILIYPFNFFESILCLSFMINVSQILDGFPSEFDLRG